VGTGIGVKGVVSFPFNASNKLLFFLWLPLLLICISDNIGWAVGRGFTGL